MGKRTKSKPQPCIHFKCSSVVYLRVGDGLAVLKSVRLNPFHRGSLFFALGTARAVLPPNPIPAASRLVCFIKILLSIYLIESELLTKAIFLLSGDQEGV